MSYYSFTSESVSEGHPDKVADQISDAILDAYLTLDANAKVACEVLITNQNCTIAGEIKSTAIVDAVAIAKSVLQRIGYDDVQKGFDYQTATFNNLLHTQSPEINVSVIDGGAGDQGLMFGFACNETPELLPLPIALSHRLVKRLAELRHSGQIKWLRPDAKSQVTVIYKNDKPVGIERIVVSTQHTEDISQEAIRETLINEVIVPIIAPYHTGALPDILINPSGSFTIGGPYGDTGLTGRKIIVDTYGGRCSHGGGAFSGKDPSKVDRSGAYIARYVAKHIVAAGIADQCTIQVSYAIGRKDPTSIFVTLSDHQERELQVLEAIRELFDLTPNGIINKLELKKPIYSETAAYGHFGKEHLPWEKLDDSILESLQLKFEFVKGELELS